MKIEYHAKIGLLPGTADKGYESATDEVRDREEAKRSYEKWIDKLEDEYHKDFVTGMGWSEAPYTLAQAIEYTRYD